MAIVFYKSRIKFFTMFLYEIWFGLSIYFLVFTSVESSVEVKE